MSRAFMRKRNTFRPTDIGNCALWLDAADSSTLTFSSGSNVSAWRDKINGYSFVGTGPVLSNFGGQQSLYFNGASYLTNNSFSPSIAPPYTVFAVAYNTTYPQTNQRILNGLSGGTYDTNLFAGVFYTYATIFTGNGANWNPLNASAQLGTMYTTWGLISAFITAAIVTPFFNGTPYSTQTGSYTAGTLTGLNIGGGYNSLTTSNNQPWYGYTGEIIFYSRTLSSPERQQVEAYLAQKWNLKTKIPQSHPGTTAIVYSQQSIPTAIYWRYQYTFTPTSIGGCQIWMDAADITSFTFSSGSNISVWKDKSGYSNNFTTVSGTNTRIADGGYSVVSFPSGAVMSSANQVNLTTSSAIFIVCKVLDAGFDMILACTNITSGSFLGDFSIRTISGVLSYGNADDIGNQNYYVNGTFNPSFGSSTYVNTYSIIDTLVSGKSGTTYLTFSSSFFSRFFIGNIAEFIFYPGGVSNPDRQQIEGYLAWKWGLQGSLDSSNPYKNSSPSTTNPAGISRPVGLPVRSIACYPTPNTQLFTVTFTYLATGDHSQTFQVPAAISPAKLTVYMWGAGGGGTTGTSRPTNYGGAGAYIQGILTVTPGETLGIIVGQGGIAITSNGAAAATTYGGGGGVPSGGNSTQNSSGGGRSAIQRAAADIVTAGAGGGSGMTNTGANPTSPVAYTLAGGAAAWTGTASAGDYPSSSSYAGQGGTTSGGGLSGNKALGDAAAAANGSQYTGGSAGQYGGGGGGGYYGGGGGTDDGGWGHGGGGGSSYTNLLANPTGSNSTNGYSAPNTSSPYYQSNVGAGGTTGVGGNGLIVLTYYS